MIEVVSPGPLGTVQDLGRAGYAHLGVPPSGAVDGASLRLANRLLGNPEGAAGIEFTLGGAELRFHDPAWVTLTGAPLEATADGYQVSMNGPVRVRRSLQLTTPAEGVRTYLAVRGGIAAPPVLGSAATDLLSGLGPPPLSDGTTLSLGAGTGLPGMLTDTAPASPIPAEPELRLHPGPRDAWLAEGAWATLCASTYTVTPDSNRVGVRFDGPPLPRREGELPSEGIVTGGLQLPPSGQPILFLTDHPTTGGYPVVAVLATADLPVAAQLRPGTRVRFRAAR